MIYKYDLSFKLGGATFMEGLGSLKCTSTVLLLAVVHDEHQKVHKSAHLRLASH